MSNLTKLFIVIAPLALARCIAAADVPVPWKEDFEGGETGKAPAGWNTSHSVLTDAVSHSGKKSVQVTPPTISPPEYVGVLNRVIEVDSQAKELWMDVYIRTPKKPTPILVEIQRGGKMLCVAGVGLGEAGRSVGGYVTRASRGDSSLWPRLYSTKQDPYTGENHEIKTDSWTRLSCRADLAAKEFEVYRDGKCEFCEMEMSRSMPDTGEFRLAVTSTSLAQGIDPTSAAFFVDDCYVGSEKPEGIDTPNINPDRPADAFMRLVVVGDTQIGPGDATSKNTIYSTMGTVVPAINRLNPDVVLFVGDLVNIADTNTFPKKPSYQEQAAQLYPVWLEEARNIKAPYYTVPGNHDPHGFYKQYIRKEIDYSFETNGVTFIAFNSSAPDNPDDWDHMGRVTPEQLAWLEAEMRKATARKNVIITFTHVTSHPNEHPLTSWVIQEGGAPLRALYNQYGVFAEFSGHQHRWLAQFKAGPTYFIISPATMGGQTGQGFGLLVYDFLPSKVLQCEKPLKMPCLTRWGRWAEHELALPSK